MGALELTPNKTPAPFKESGKVGAKMASELLNKGVMIRQSVEHIRTIGRNTLGVKLLK